MKFKSAGQVLAAVLWMLACGGCIVTSVGPFYTEEAVVASPELLGSWHLVANGSQNYKDGEVKPWVFNADKALTFDEKGRGGPFLYKVFAIGNEKFLDAVPDVDDSVEVSAFWAISVLPVHTLFLLQVNGDEAVLVPLNYEWFEKEQKSGLLSTARVTPSNAEWDSYRLSPAEWMAFLTAHLGEKDFFRDDSKIILKRK